MKLNFSPGSVNKYDRRTKEYRNIVFFDEYNKVDERLTHKTTLKKWNSK